MKWPLNPDPATTYELLSGESEGEKLPLDEITPGGADGVFFTKAKISGNEMGDRASSDKGKPIEQHPDWVKYKAESEAEGWGYDAAAYIGELPKDDDNFFMAKPIDALHYNAEGEFLDRERMDELKALLNRNVTQVRLEGRLTLHVGEFAEQLRKTRCTSSVRRGST